MYDLHGQFLYSDKPDLGVYVNGERGRPSHFPVGPHRKAFFYYDTPEVREHNRFIQIDQAFSGRPQSPSALRETVRRNSSNESEFRERLRALERAAQVLSRCGNGSKR